MSLPAAGAIAKLEQSALMGRPVHQTRLQATFSLRSPNDIYEQVLVIRCRPDYNLASDGQQDYSHDVRDLIQDFGAPNSGPFIVTGCFAFLG